MPWHLNASTGEGERGGEAPLLISDFLSGLGWEKCVRGREIRAMRYLYPEMGEEAVGIGVTELAANSPTSRQERSVPCWGFKPCEREIPLCVPSPPPPVYVKPEAAAENFLSSIQSRRPGRRGNRFSTSL